MIQRIFTVLVFMQLSVMLYSQNTIKGVVTDAETGETIIGCNIMLQGTTIGTITGMDGEYAFNNIPSGTYNVIYSYISYEKQIQKITIAKDSKIVNNVKLQSSSTQIKDVTVTAQRRTDTEISMLSVTRQGLTIANGITSQQIARSQDKDASEVIRRVPGVSIRDGKFVIVRGLTERYNSVWLNGSSTPSSESDVRAFSFDVIPSGQIDNILIYKTPAPELPADFAGAMINIKTKSLIDRNSVSVSASVGYSENTTFGDFYTYQGGSTDWLGYDDGTRAIPSIVPSSDEYIALVNSTTNSKIEQIERINSISKSFSTIMTPYKNTAKPDADVQFSINRRFALGSVSIGSITAIGYNSSRNSESGIKADYSNFTDTAYTFNQSSNVDKVRVSALSNWTLTFGNNQKIEFRNLFNNTGASKTVLKDGFDIYRENFDRAYEMSYESRATYSGQLAGNHSFNGENSKLDWVGGYSFANKNQPDMRYVNSTLYKYGDLTNNYVINMSREVTLNSKGRLYLKNNENIWNGAINFSHKFEFNNFKPELKTGIYYEKKSKDVTSRSFGYIWKNNNYSLLEIPVMTHNDSAAFTDAMFKSLQDIFENKIDFKNGIIMGESTNKSNSYSANNDLLAVYLGLNLPVLKSWSVYLGTRVEKNKLVLDGFNRQLLIPINVNHDDLDFFPTINSTINLTDDLLFRIAGGRTINRPEFREISPFTFYNFEERVLIYGNDSLQNCYINNADVRFEWYPTAEEIVSIGAFYKDFTNPIEAHMIVQSGGNADFTYFNAKKAKTYGLELDIRKRLHEFEKTSMSFLSNFTFVVNASIIKSIINVEESTTERNGIRTMQGQSPYTINVGAYYNDRKSNFMTSIMYNKVGERIHAVGNVHHPHIFEQPFNSLDLTIEKSIFKNVNIKFGVKNLLDDDVIFNQTAEKFDDITKEVIETKTQLIHKFKPGRQFKLGISVNL